ncbi:uncharacterized protein L199_006477 [Kwoniella botswanensis]|uniref:uncharacterized protein n=1 Tax=Kwoniella botswanensis TaxID=1268659 RepID=UPI00315D9FD8
MPQQSAQSSSETDPTAICSCKRTDHPNDSTQWGCNNTVQGSQQFCDERCRDDPLCHASLTTLSQNMHGNSRQGGTDEVAFETFDSMSAHFVGRQQGSSSKFDFSAPSRPPERGTAGYDRVSTNDLLSMQEQVARMGPEEQRTFHEWFSHYARTGEEWYNPDGGQHNPNAG